MVYDVRRRRMNFGIAPGGRDPPESREILNLSYDLPRLRAKATPRNTELGRAWRSVPYPHSLRATQ